MARMIDADILQELCNKRIKDTWNSNTAPVSWAEANADFKDDIDSIPTLTPPNDWISVKDRLPKLGQYVAVYTQFFCSIGVRKIATHSWMEKNESGSCDIAKTERESWYILTEDGCEVSEGDDRVDYWCELPDLPEKERREMKEWLKRYGENL